MTVEEAQAQIARARSDLASRDLEDKPSADSSTSSTPKTGAEPAPKPRTSTTPGAGAGDAQGPSRNADTCGSPCRAIASMRRAVTALCRMTGTEDTRCVDAKKTLAESEARVASCPCHS